MTPKQRRLTWRALPRPQHDVKRGQWYPTKAEAIAAFERSCKRKGISPPLRYPLSVSGDSITRNDLAYPRRTSAAGMREGHDWVCVDTHNDLLPR